MRLLSLLTSTISLIVLQTLISSWFLYDFFLARDSLTANSLWNPSHKISYSNDGDEVQVLSDKIRNKHCQQVNTTVQNKTLFDKVVLIIIDALGSEFIKSIENDEISKKDFSMPFVEDAIINQKAMGFIAKAATPTVTMPRIKALLSGTIPSFVDVVYNLASDVSKFTDDNILRVAKAHDKSIVFYGDDTWLSLFERNIFTRAEETLSFYASDYISVDTNVTRLAIPETELNTIDWDYLILHYLGLDHIGHVFGTNKTPKIKDKLVEMDDVVRKIYNNLSAKKDLRTLVVIFGDHGMSVEGNHGGNSKLEVETAMIFMPINQNFNIKEPNFDRHIKQIDFSVTLSLLTGLPIPIMSRGVAIKPLLESLIFDNQKLSCYALENVLQLIDLMDKKEFNNSHDRVELISLLNGHYNSDLVTSDIIQDYYKIARRIQDKLIDIITTNSNPILIVTMLTFISFFSMIGLKRTCIHSLLILTYPKFEQLLCIIVLLIPILMQGSMNFIESENLFWPLYSFISLLGFFSFAVMKDASITKNLDPIRVIIYIISFIYSFCWNNFKIYDSYIFKENISNSVLVFIASLILCNSMMQICDIFAGKSKKIVLIILVFQIMFCRIIEDSPSYGTFVILIQRLVMISLIVYTLANLFKNPAGSVDEPVGRFIRKLSSFWIGLAFLLVRQNNILFVIINLMMETSVNSIVQTLKLSRLTRLLLYIHFAQSAFYNQGNSNLFTTIDVKPAFFGQTQYNIFLSVPLVIISTYSLQIYWYLKLFHRFQATTEYNDSQKDWIYIKTNMMKSILDFVTIRNFLSLTYYMYVCVVLRNHLFIWSVISPKLLYHYVTNNIILIVCLFITCLHQIKTSFMKSDYISFINSSEKTTIV